MLSKEEVLTLYNNRYGFTEIAKIAKVSKQRIHQIITGYKSLSSQIQGLGLFKLGKCQICNKKATETHHIDKNTHNNIPTNLLTLCKSCHGKQHTGTKKNIKLLHGWSKNYDSCIRCNMTKYKHSARGICNNCYRRKQDRLKSRSLTPFCCKYHSKSHIFVSNQVAIQA